jgi:hypothetical protein
LALAAASGAAATTVRPSLRLASVHPLRVSGQHFRRHEHVKVLVVSGERRYTRTLAATAAGAFTTSFGEIPRSRCEAFTVTAVGSLGSRVLLKLPRPQCLPVGSTG